ncbi:hypothetical protein BFL28_19935 [Sphingomonas turrisvirgatae]|uniref:Uncharacterized protein n=1 Tax=Sphingomonas turrisvirgatae TaxID=1888892 RepID=A0A1E3LR53_9SPHN|nr:hypothetical protein BFL28_19935 [Sphingomonas turrisvirgatae]
MADEAAHRIRSAAMLDIAGLDAFARSGRVESVESYPTRLSGRETGICSPRHPSLWGKRAEAPRRSLSGGLL